jgi:Tfp pilus assembly protein PilN
MEGNIAVLEWSPDGVRAHNPAMRQTASGTSVADVLPKVGSPGAVGLCLSRRVSFVRETHVPAVEKSELRLIVSVQLESLFPAVRSELAFDYDLGTHRYEDGVQTTVCATQAETLRAALRECEAAGVKVAWAAPTALGSVNVARSAGHDDAIVVEQDGPVINLDIVRHGMLVYSRSAVVGEDKKERQAEVSRTLAGYGLPSAAVIAVGDTDLGEDVRSSREGSLQAMAVHDPDRINVELPEAIATKVKRASAAKSRVALFLWLVVLVGGTLVFLDRDEAAKEAAARDQRVTGRVTSLQKDVDLYGDRLKNVEQSAASLDLAFKPAQTVGDVLTVVANSVPQNAWLAGVTFERGKPLQIRGVAMNGEAVTAFVSQLAVDSRFRDVQLVFANNSDIESVPVVQFAITAHVVGNLPLAEDQTKKRGGR